MIAAVERFTDNHYKSVGTRLKNNCCTCQTSRCEGQDLHMLISHGITMIGRLPQRNKSIHLYYCNYHITVWHRLSAIHQV